MAVSKAVLRIQTDQILESPEIREEINLKDEAATNTLKLDWDEPAGTDRTVTFPDPGADDTVVYEDNAQTLSNKSFATDITMLGSKEVKGLPAVPTSPDASASKAYVDSLIGGQNWKEVLLAEAQLDSVNNGINQATTFYLVNNAIIGDTFTISDGVTTETWTFSGASAAFAPAVLGTPLATMNQLVSRINSDSTTWSAALVTSLQSINVCGEVVIVYRTIPTTPVNDRIFGVFATPADAQYVNFGGTSEYSSTTIANLPSADPATANFGFSRLSAALQENEAHQIRDSDTIYMWDGDLDAWTLSSGGAGTTAASPTGLITRANLVKDNIPAVTAPTADFISTDIPVEKYSPAATNGRQFSIVVPDDYDSGDIDVLVLFQMSSASASNIVLETRAKIVKTTGSVDTATFPATSQVFTPPSNTDITRSVVLTLTNPVGSPVFARGDQIQFFLKRLGADGSDTHPGDFIVISCQHRYLGQVATRIAAQVGEVTGPVMGEALPSPGFFSTDIPTADFVGGADRASSFYFIVPDHWDGFSDAHLTLQYAMSGASGGTVRVETNGNMADVVGGSGVVLATQTFDIATTADADPHRTTIIRSVPGSLLAKGNFLQVSLKRDTSVGGNNPDDFQLLNATLTIGVTPVSGIVTQTDQFLARGVFGNDSGTVSGSVEYPDFLGDFEEFHRLLSTSAAGELHVAFEGRLVDTQTAIDSILVVVKGVGASPNYDLKVYVEGAVGAAFSSGVTPAPAGATKVTIAGASLSAQPTIGRRYFVVLEAFIDAGEEVLVSRPFVRQS